MKRIHYISGIALTLFIGLHLFNHFWSIFGIEKHIEMMHMIRPVYRNIMVESILLFAVCVQILSGVKLVRKKRKEASSFFEKLHVWSGLYLAFFLVIHVSAVMMGRFVLKLDTNIYFGIAGLNTFPYNLFFIPYYSLSVIAFFGHIAAIHSLKMKGKILGVSVKSQSFFFLLVGALLSIVLLAGFTNNFTGVEIPEAYHVLIGK